MDTTDTIKVGSKQDTLIILGSNGNIGKALIANKDQLQSKFSFVYCFDIRREENFVNSGKFLQFIKADIVHSSYLSNLNLDPSFHKLTCLNLVAQDYPVTPTGLGHDYSSPFCLETSRYLESIAITAGSSYNLFNQIDRLGFYDSSVWLIGSIYNKILPDPALYSDDSSIYKPIAYSSGKYAQLPLRDQAAVYFGSFGGRCNSLSFGGIQTVQQQSFIDRYSSMCPSGRLVGMDEVVSTIMWALLGSPESMNGADILIDGAFHLK